MHVYYALYQLALDKVNDYGQGILRLKIVDLRTEIRISIKWMLN